jgi:glycyl-tRNA synthetase beta chain
VTKELLLEIGVEEIPSAYMPGILEELKDLSMRKLGEARLQYDSLQTYGTPRRIVLHVIGLQERQADALLENRGPKKAIAFDANGAPTKPCLGFARSQGLAPEDLEIRTVGGIEYMFAVKKQIGVPAAELLPALLTSIITSIGFPKSMRWGYHSTRFARPIRWLLALYGDSIIDISIENVVSSNYTYGHRFLSPEPLQVNTISEYFKLLQENYVILDQEERCQMIRQQVADVAAGVGGVPVDSEKLLEENNYLVEYPTAFYGRFSPSYLQVPPEVLTTSMITNQRYFPIFDDQGKLMPGFIGIRNGTAHRLDLVTAGNERVLKARLEDALFFWNEDTKKPLAEFVPGLEKVMFHERLGSVMDRVKRLQKLAVFIGEQTGLSNTSDLERAAYLCKADLTTSMVYEFTELQGVMGRYYARKSGENDEVSEAIFEHYLPRFAGDILPATETGIVLSLTEKIDNLTGCFCINIKPTGSQDPYALRRQALGVVNIILENGLNIELQDIIRHAYQSFLPVNPDNSAENTINEVGEFLKQRLRGIMLDKGFTYDVIDAVFALPGCNLKEIVSRAQALQEFKKSPRWDDLMTVFNRSHNLSKKWDSVQVNTEVFEHESEKVLYQNFLTTQSKVQSALQERDYTKAFLALADMRPALDTFFEAVMVMVEDDNLRAARLGLLKNIAVLCHSAADFGNVIL